MADSSAPVDKEESWVRCFPPYWCSIEVEELNEFYVLHQQVVPNRVVPCCVDCAEISEIAAIAVEKINSDRISEGMKPLNLVRIIHATKQYVSGSSFCLQILFKQTKDSNNERTNSLSCPIYFFQIYRNIKGVIDIKYEEIALFADVPGGRWQLLSGNFMPKIGFQCSPDWDELAAEKWIQTALEAGFRIRTDVFITAKINIVRPETTKQLFIATRDIDKDQFHSVSDYAQFSVAKCVEQFDGYIDLCMVHYPKDVFKEVSNICSKNREERAAVYGVLEEYFEIGIIRSVGAANFEPDHVEHLVKDGHSMPVVVQCEMHPFLQRDDLLDYCKSKDIFLQAHSIFAYKNQTPSHAAQLQRYTSLKKISTLYKISTSQLTLSYLMQCSPQVGAVIVEQPDDLYDKCTGVMQCAKLREALTNLVSCVDTDKSIRLRAEHMRTMKGLDMGKFDGRFTKCEQWKVM
ncbi:hypothetical protein niasHT_027802 [Heterodera trifolii]|uniref:NADP-dependent oxidoreductase domain-containing protein n=1 Tax=Heterodera trifolii TaxID=157864 RepID=A0ABD2JFV0_9BILA